MQRKGKKRATSTECTLPSCPFDRKAASGGDYAAVGFLGLVRLRPRVFAGPAVRLCRPTASINPGCFATIWRSTSAGPCGVRWPASHACTSFVLTFNCRANTACEALSAARTRFTARPSSGFGGRSRVVVRRSRLPFACSNASFIDPSSSAKVASFMTSSLLPLRPETRWATPDTQ